MRHSFAIILFALLIAASPRAAELPQSDLSFLLGNWTGSGAGDPGKGSGSFAFAAELQGRVIVRRAHSEYPAAGKRPAVVHDDLLIVYAESSKAIYFDNEGHVIHYNVSVDANTKTATFLSTDPPPSPAFRLTYRQTSEDEIEVAFEMSPSGKISGLKPDLAGSAKRQRPERK